MKYKLEKELTSHDMQVVALTCRGQQTIPEVTEYGARTPLMNLRSDSETGPDELPASVLYEFAEAIAKLVRILANLILSQSR